MVDESVRTTLDLSISVSVLEQKAKMMSPTYLAKYERLGRVKRRRDSFIWSHLVTEQDGEDESEALHSLGSPIICEWSDWHRGRRGGTALIIRASRSDLLVADRMTLFSVRFLDPKTMTRTTMMMMMMMAIISFPAVPRWTGNLFVLIGSMLSPFLSVGFLDSSRSNVLLLRNCFRHLRLVISFSLHWIER